MHVYVSYSMIQYLMYSTQCAHHILQYCICIALPHTTLAYGWQEADEASVIANAKGRLPPEPAKADPSACRIGKHP